MHVSIFSAGVAATLLAAVASVDARSSFERRQQLTPLTTCPTTPLAVVANGLGWNVCANSQYNVPSQQWPSTASNAACAQQCANTNGCNTAVWDHATTSCHIKGSPTTLNFVADTRFDAVKLAYTPAKTGTTITTCPWGNSTYVTNGKTFAICPIADYVGPSVSIINGYTNNTACADLCAKTANCQRAVWDRNNNVCHLKDVPTKLTWGVNPQFDTITIVVATAASTTTTTTAVSTSSTAAAQPTAPAAGVAITTCPTTPTLMTANGLGWSVCNNTQYNVPSQQWPNTASNAACAQLCATTNGCTAAVWDHKVTSCHIKGNPNALNWITDTNYDAVRLDYTPNIGMGINACPWGNTSYTASGKAYTVCPLTDYAGNTITMIKNVASTAACADLCGQSNANCQRAVFDRTNNNCHLKDVGPTVQWIVAPNFDTVTLTSALLVAKTGAKAKTTEIIGTCGVNALHLQLATADTLYLVDKTQADTLPLVSRQYSALAAAYSLSNGTCRPMPTVANQFCAVGGVRPDGSFVSAGGNPQQNGQGQTDGLRAVRTVAACDNGANCQWNENNGQLQVARWYPGGETTGDGSMVWLGGYNAQVFMPYPKSGNTPTAEYFPSKGAPISVPVLDRAWPFSLYPSTAHLSDGRIFIMSGNETAVWDPATQQELRLPTMPNGPRTYPSGGASALLPLTPANNYAETQLLCGGSGVTNWGTNCPADGSYATPASTKCDKITPLAANAAWTSAADMPIPRLMGNFINLPDNTIALVNGAQAGTQGFGCNAPGESMASKPAFQSYTYDPVANTWTPLATSIASRGYHSSATLLPDGSILAGGSSPHWDINPTLAPFPTEFRLEKIYPSYYDQPRPSNANVPTSYTYGGASFTITLNSAADAQNAYMRIIRTGWSTHGLNYGARSFELQRSINGASVTFSGLPNNANIFPPGSALAFLVVNGVPSIGKMSIVGTGK